MFISIDPGYRVGVATFRDDGSPVAKTSMVLPEFRLYLGGLYDYSRKHNERMRFLYEDFTLRQDMAIQQTGSDMPAPRAIGALEQIATMLGDMALIEKSQPRNLKTALKWAGYPELAKKPRSWHCPDELSAYSHGVMWLINLGIRKHPIFES